MWNKDQKTNEIALVVFKPECAPIIAGVSCTKVEAGWKNCEIIFDKGGIVVTVPGQRPTFVHLSNTRQVDFQV